MRFVADITKGTEREFVGPFYAEQFRGIAEWPRLQMLVDAGWQVQAIRELRLASDVLDEIRPAHVESESEDGIVIENRKCHCAIGRNHERGESTEDFQIGSAGAIRKGERLDGSAFFCAECEKRGNGKPAGYVTYTDGIKPVCQICSVTVWANGGKVNAEPF